MPWGKAEKALEAFDCRPSPEVAVQARDAVDDLKRLESIPGVKNRRADLEKRLVAGRVRYFEALLEARELESSSLLLREFAVPARRDDETIRVAHLAYSLGRPGPRIGEISPASVKWELRPAYYETVYHESKHDGDDARLREIVVLWLQHDASAVTPNAFAIRDLLSRGDFDGAISHFRGLIESAARQVAIVIREDDGVDSHAKAHLFLQSGCNDLAGSVLDTILAEHPDDDWALMQRANLADQSLDGDSARRLYARILARDSSRSQIARRLAELAQSANDHDDAKEKFEMAWRSGDTASGFSYLGYFMRSDRGRAGEIARELAAGVSDAESLLAVGEVFLDLEMAADAADALQRSIDIDTRLTDAVIGKAHEFVEKRKSGRLPLLRLLATVAPIRGYPADIYSLMEVDEHLGAGNRSDAINCLERLMRTELRWKALSRLAEITLDEGNASRLRTAERIEAALPHADAVGRSVWAELAYYSARLLEAAGRKDDAKRRYEELLGREFQYRDVEARMEALRSLNDGGQDKTVVLKRPVAPAARYEILEQLGEGGMGSVYRARDRKLDRIVALKIVTMSGDPRAEELLVREARTTAGLSHPNIVGIFDVEKESDRWSIAMEFVDGPTLKSIITRGALPASDSVTVIEAVLSALIPAHESGIVHRDIKPANIMVRGGAITRENVKLCDFGLARVATDASIVLPGTVAGTAAYMAPEQIRGEKVGPQSDIYSCGCVFYEMIRGEPLFRSESMTTTMFMHLNEEPGRLMANDVLADEKLTQLLLGFLARDLSTRFRSAAEALAGVRKLAVSH